MIEVEGLVVARGKRDVVSGVSLRVRPGQLVVVVGPNGSGKSSLVAAVSGDLGYRHGSIRIGGADVAATPAMELARLRAVMTQNNPVSFGFTVREVVGFGRSPWRGREETASDDALVAAAIAAMDLDALADRPVQALSGGELARTAMARALAQNTPVLILDEPTAALDLRHQMELLSAVRRRVTEGAAALVILHDLTLAAEFADQVIVLDRGRVAASGDPAQVLVPEILSPVYQVPIITLPNPHTAAPIIVAARTGS